MNKGKEEVIRSITNKNNKKPIHPETLHISSDIKDELDLIRIHGDTYDTILRTLINVFKDPSLKSIYEKRKISEEYYHRSLTQRRLSKVGYFDKIKDTGTRAYDEDRYAKLKRKPPFFNFNEKPRYERKKYINKIVLHFSDYDLETIAHLQHLTGLSRPQDVLLTCLKFCYMIFSQDRLIRNSNAELAEKNLNLMIENSSLDSEPIIPIYGHHIPSVGREIMDSLKLHHNVKNNHDLMRKLVKDAYDKIDDET